MRHRRRAWRIARTAVLYLLLGAIATVAVAWACAAWSQLDKRTPVVSRVSGAEDKAWLACLEWEPRKPTDQLIHEPMSNPSRGFGLTLKEFVETARPNPTFHGDLHILRVNGPAFAERLMTGWPARALAGGRIVQGEISFDASVRWRTIDGIDIPGHLKSAVVFSPTGSRSLGVPRLMPIRPLWPGFAIDTLFYALILFVLIRGPLALRRLMRRRGGRCAMCGYDLRHAPHHACPECGAAIGA